MKILGSVLYVSAQRKKCDVTLHEGIKLAEDYLSAGGLHYTEVKNALFVRRIMSKDNSENRNKKYLYVEYDYSSKLVFKSARNQQSSHHSPLTCDALTCRYQFYHSVKKTWVEHVYHGFTANKDVYRDFETLNMRAMEHFQGLGMSFSKVIKISDNCR